MLPSRIFLKLAATVVVEEENSQDIIRSGESKDGGYSVSTAYKLVHNRSSFVEIDSPVFRVIWKIKAQERVRTFAWLVVRGGVLTNAERWRRHLTEDDACPCCSSEPELALHLFRDCGVVTDIWTKLKPPFSWTEFYGSNYAQWLRLNLLHSGPSVKDKAWASIFAVALWNIWKWRNSWVFRKERFMGDKADFVLGIVKEYKEASVLDRVTNMRSVDEILVNWTRPPKQWVKLNTDGSVGMVWPLQEVSFGAQMASGLWVLSTTSDFARFLWRNCGALCRVSGLLGTGDTGGFAWKQTRNWRFCYLANLWSIVTPYSASSL
ncbi:uncharacterized protein A4U43_C05F7260 [Asparagus officinalis]|uniref:Reverse transcriptase zinc-binding domain-containing protein n=1 Tax=Asparagus officinalis TaxID=4686 RepID=A0A5P1EQK2_ASPOF|nr:uncharacterized protein A4U43_C05F7260 [Asparagus officinalis]